MSWKIKVSEMGQKNTSQSLRYFAWLTLLENYVLAVSLNRGPCAGNWVAKAKRALVVVVTVNIVSSYGTNDVFPVWSSDLTNFFKNIIFSLLLQEKKIVPKNIGNLFDKNLDGASRFVIRICHLALYQDINNM